jgi:ubiquinone/menaquinone biosynthesis C-methylase UbiE
MSKHHAQNARVLDQFAQQAESYSGLIKKFNDPSLPLIMASVQPKPSERLLDVGCGAGNFAVMMASIVGQVFGVDLTPEMLDQARALQAEAGVKNVEWRQTDVTSLPFERGSFDIVSSRSMLHHVEDPRHVIAEMKRVADETGRLMVIDMTPAPEKAAALNAIELLRDPSHARALTLSELRAIATDLDLVEIGFAQREVRLPLEAILATSFPGPGVLDRVRQLYRSDAESGADALGLGARIADGAVTVGYPMSFIAWRLS